MAKSGEAQASVVAATAANKVDLFMARPPSADSLIANPAFDFIRFALTCSSGTDESRPMRSSADNVKSSDEARPARRRPESLSKLKKAARKLFVERGYHATRPQDIAREAGLGHGTFYLHYPDKRACFLSFVADAREELDDHVRARRMLDASLEQRIATTLTAIYEYADNHPGVLRAAMTDRMVIDAEGVEARSLLAQWGAEWADLVRDGARDGSACASYDADIIGQAIVGALHQASRESHRAQRCRTALVENLTRFLIRALKPDPN